MGVEKFSAILNKHAPQNSFEVPLEEFQGRRIALDMNHLVYRMMDPAIKEMLTRVNLIDGKPRREAIEELALPKILDRLVVLMKHGITPVCIMDGYPVDLKKNGNPKKKEQKMKQKAKYKETKDVLYSTEMFFRTTKMVEDFTKQYRNVKVRPAFMDRLKDVLANIGFPVFGAETFGIETNDAEAICALLCMNEYCFAGYTTDSDFHVYGGNLQITDIVYRDTKDGRKYFAQIRSMENLLQQLTFSAQQRVSGVTTMPPDQQFTFDLFQDLCILLGNDFNTNIPQMGEVGCWKTILQYGSVEALSKVRDVSILKYEQVKSLYCSTQIKVELAKDKLEFNQEHFKANGRNVLLMAQLGSYFDRIIEVLPNLTTEIMPQVEIEIISDEMGDDGETRIELSRLQDALNNLETNVVTTTTQSAGSLIEL